MGDIYTAKEMMEKQIERTKSELRLLKLDKARVYTDVASQAIQSEIEILERILDRKQFKLWKLEKEGEDE